MNLNKQSKWRFEVAEYLFSKIDIDSNLLSFFVGGSVARNCADEYSDLELCFVWKKEVSKKIRIVIYDQMGLNLKKISDIKDNTIPFGESYNFRNLKLDIWHLTENNINKTLSSVQEDLDIDIQKMNLLETFQSCIPIYGLEFILELNTKIVYKRALGLKIVDEYSKTFFRANFDLFILRKDNTLCYTFIAKYLKHIYIVLEAINFQYSLSSKRIHFSLQKLKIKPKNIISLYQNINKLDIVEAWTEIKSLKLEIIELIKIHYPEIDLSRIERNMKIKRAKLDDSII